MTVIGRRHPRGRGLFFYRNASFFSINMNYYLTNTRLSELEQCYNLTLNDSERQIKDYKRLR